VKGASGSEPGVSRSGQRKSGNISGRFVKQPVCTMEPNELWELLSETGEIGIDGSVK